jgi:hypothetical protein
MHLAYYDESGDDGHPSTSTDLFVLSAVYLHHQDWKETFQRIRDFRRGIAKTHGLPFSLEFHTREFLLNKKPYRGLALSPDRRREILELFCHLTGNLTLRIIKVVINKKAIKWAGYPVLENAFTYSIQRIENDLKQAGARFLIITDEGRVGKMRQTARRIQRFNPIPSKFGAEAYRKEIENLVEDPLPKNSKESYFTQLADMISYVVSLHQRAELELGPFPGRLAGVIDFAGVQTCLDLIKPSLNLKAAPAHTYGIVCYPK